MRPRQYTVLLIFIDNCTTMTGEYTHTFVRIDLQYVQ